MNEENKGYWDFLKSIFSYLKDQAPAFGMLIYDLMSAKIARAEQEKRDAVYNEEIQKNHEQVDSDKRSDSAIVDEISGSGGSDTKVP